MRLTQYSVAVTTAGSAGSATGSGTLTIDRVGYLEWIYIDYDGSAPATTDVTIANSATPPGGNVLVATNSATDTLYLPRGKPVDNAGSAITNAHSRFAVGGPLSVSVAQCDAITDAVTVYVGISG